MFPTLKLISSPCPQLGSCTRQPCLFSHTPPKQPIPKARAVSSTTASANRTEFSSAGPSSLSGPASAQSILARSAQAGSSAAAGVAPQESSLTGTGRQGKGNTSMPARAPAQTKAAVTGSRPMFAVKRPVVKAGPGGGKTAATATKPSITTGSSSPSNASGSTRPPGLFRPGAVHSSAFHTPHARAGTRDLNPVSSNPPILHHTLSGGHTALTIRNKYLRAIFNEFVRLYAELPWHSNPMPSAKEDALAQEAAVFKRTNKATYVNGAVSAIARLKKRAVCKSVGEAGTLEVLEERARAQQAKEKGAEGEEYMTAEVLRMGYCVSRENRQKLGYIDAVEDDWGRGGSQKSAMGMTKACRRCGKDFVVRELESEADRKACPHHWGKIGTQVVGGVKQRVHKCCGTVDGPPCDLGPHVFEISSPAELHQQHPFTPLHSSTSATTSATTSSSSSYHDIIALDCELCYTLSGLSLTRLTLVDVHGLIVLDEFVRPPSAILDLNTAFSGVTRADMERAVLDIEGVKEAMAHIVGPETVLVGHGVENDLKALRFLHPWVVDTADLYPHRSGPPMRIALRALAAEHLQVFIQDQDPTVGHDSAIDARTALDLVKHRIKRDVRLRKLRKGPDGKPYVQF